VTEAYNAPAAAPVLGKAAELRRLELLVTRKLDGLLHGEFLGFQPGPGTEFHGARAYEAGDDARRIDWNLSARSLGPQLRTTLADRELQTWVVLDSSSSMYFGTSEREKADVAFASVAAFGFLTARQGNHFGVMVGGRDEVTRLAPSSTRVGLMATLSRLYDFPRREEAPAENADLAATLRALERAHPRRGLVIVVSDFLDTGEWDRSLARLSIAHQVLAVQVVDRREYELPAAGMLTLVDAETGREIEVQSNSAALRLRYAAAARERHDMISNKIRKAGAGHLVLATDRDWLLDIVRFVAGSRTIRRTVTTLPDQRAGASQLRSVQ
jgi:uncharacterized protein (DUF58 family)